MQVPEAKLFSLSMFSQAACSFMIANHISAVSYMLNHEHCNSGFTF